MTLFTVWMRNYHKSLLDFVGRNKIFILLIITLAVFNLFFSTSVFASVYKWLKLIELIIFYYYVRIRSDVFKSKTLTNTLFYSLVFFSIIGILQFVFGSTLGGPLYLLGERSFNISTPGIALVDIFGRNFMRAYSTFSHPNSLAGYLGVGLIMLLFAYSKKELLKKSLGITIICVVLFLTFSLSAFIGIAFCIVFFLIIRNNFFDRKNIIYIPAAFLLISLTLPFFSKVVIQSRLNFPQNINERIELSLGAGRMISQKFLLGTGLNTFVINETRTKYMSSYIWILQPVHNIFLLIFSEIGIFGLMLFYFILIRATQKAIVLNDKAFYLILLFVLVTGFIDHYWFTLQQNLLLLALVFGNSLRAEG